MKKAFLVTSAIEVDNNFPLTYSHVRSHFGTEERLRQTISTIVSLDLASDKDTTIFIIDISPNSEKYKDVLSWSPKVKFVSVKEHFPEIHERVNTHINKSHCETLILATFLRQWRRQLEEYDYFFKMSGRYLVDSSFDITLFNEIFTNKIFYKKHFDFEWDDKWNYGKVDLRSYQGDNRLRQYCSVLFGWGKGYYSQYVDFFTAVSTMLNHPDMKHFDIETLSYFLTRPFQHDIIETNWKVLGWDGVNGYFKRY